MREYNLVYSSTGAAVARTAVLTTGLAVGNRRVPYVP